MNCAFCGFELLARARFCVQCGNQVLADTPQPPEVRVPEPRKGSAQVVELEVPALEALAPEPQADDIDGFWGEPLAPRVAPQPAPQPLDGDPGPAAGPAQGLGAAAALAAIDEGFDAFFQEMPEATPAPPAASAADLAVVHDLFQNIVKENARPIRDFMLELAWGEPNRVWLDVCVPALGSLQKAAEQLDLPELAARLADFVAICEDVRGRLDASIAGSREAFQVGYGRLADVMPDAFRLDGEQNHREALILHGLLLQVRDVRKVTLDKLFGAGLTSLSTFLTAKPGDIATTTGLPIELATRIVDRFQDYKAELAAMVPTEDRREERLLLAQLVRELRALHEEHERRARGWSKEDQAKRRQLAQARELTMHKIQVRLAHLGATQRLGEIERAPYARKLEILDAVATPPGAINDEPPASGGTS